MEFLSGGIRDVQPSGWQASLKPMAEHQLIFIMSKIFQWNQVVNRLREHRHTTGENVQRACGEQRVKAMQVHSDGFLCGQHRC